MTSLFKVFIPARYNSTRLPGKALLKIGDKSLIQHVYDTARFSGAVEVIVVTDDDRIHDAATAFGATAIMTSREHESGTERIAEAVSLRNEDDDSIIVNVQGDAYGLSPELIDQVAGILDVDNRASVATLREKITDIDSFHNPNVVKVVTDVNHHALYFSRSAIPWQQAGTSGPACQSSKHIGIYACRAGFQKAWAALPASEAEKSERLEQLRVLHHGYAIHVAVAGAGGGFGIDTEADLERARQGATGD